eukprot:TRINITY_DN48079_c0_g1_i1.p1 TRINITY_DN48079_c0_g1~~TRINITY_DN48079_c0_g1_i1.p1  ORF type:complete len:1701 (+),score=295.19 TRINITY_DN48079_c0_g1_i1:130-5232(+)
MQGDFGSVRLAVVIALCLPAVAAVSRSGSASDDWQEVTVTADAQQRRLWSAQNEPSDGAVAQRIIRRQAKGAKLTEDSSADDSTAAPACALPTRWCTRLLTAGLSTEEVAGLSVTAGWSCAKHRRCGQEWLYGLKPLLVGFGDSTAPCDASRLFCAGRHSNGYEIDQLEAVQAALRTGSAEHPAAPSVLRSQAVAGSHAAGQVEASLVSIGSTGGQSPNETNETASETNETQAVVRLGIGDLISLGGRKGRIAADSRPRNETVRVEWDDDGSISGQLAISTLTYEAGAPDWSYFGTVRGGGSADGCAPVAGSWAVKTHGVKLQPGSLRFIDLSPQTDLVVDTLSFYCALESKLTAAVGIYEVSSRRAGTSRLIGSSYGPTSVGCSMDEWLNMRLSKAVRLKAGRTYHLALLHVSGEWSTATGVGNRFVKTFGKHFYIPYAAEDLRGLVSLQSLKTYEDEETGTLLFTAKHCFHSDTVKYQHLKNEICANVEPYTNSSSESSCRGWSGLSLAQCKDRCTFNLVPPGCGSAWKTCRAFLFESGRCHLYDECAKTEAMTLSRTNAVVHRKVLDGPIEYLGCFQDGASNKDMDAAFDVIQENHTKSGTLLCREECFRRGKSLFAMQDKALNLFKFLSGWCQCGDTFGTQDAYVRLESSACNSVCPNEVGLEPERKCGALEANAIYTVKMDPTYVGCFADDADHDLKFGPGTVEVAGTATNFTTVSCMQACSGHRYFALQDHGSCFCGDSYNVGPQYYQVLDKECGEPCAGEEASYPLRRCGAKQLNAVYSAENRAASCWTVDSPQSHCHAMNPYPVDAPLPSATLTPTEAQRFCDSLGSACGGFIFYTTAATISTPGMETSRVARATFCEPLSHGFRAELVMASARTSAGTGYIRSWRDECGVRAAPEVMDLDAHRHAHDALSRWVRDSVSGDSFGNLSVSLFKDVYSWNLEATYLRTPASTWGVSKHYTMCFWVHWRSDESTFRTLFRSTTGDAALAVEPRSGKLGVYKHATGFHAAVKPVTVVDTNRSCASVARDLAVRDSPTACAKAAAHYSDCGPYLQFAYTTADTKGAGRCACCGTYRHEGGVETSGTDIYAGSFFEADTHNWNFLCAVGKSVHNKENETSGQTSNKTSSRTSFFFATAGDSAPRWVGDAPAAISGSRLASLGDEKQFPGRLSMVKAWNQILSNAQMQEVFLKTKPARYSCDMPRAFCDAMKQLGVNASGPSKDVVPIAYIQQRIGTACANEPYTANEQANCSGWRGLTAVQCQDKCTSNAKADNCPQRECKAYTLSDEASGRVCHLYSECQEPHKPYASEVFHEKTKPRFSRCQWRSQTGKAVHMAAGAEGAMDIARYNPYKDAYDTEEGCQDVCDSLPNCQGYSYMIGDRSNKDHMKCFLVQKLPETADMVNTTDFNVGICGRDEPGLVGKIAVSVWTYRGKSTMVAAGGENETCDQKVYLCAGYESKYNPGYSSFGRAIDQAYQVREAVANGGLHPQIMLSEMRKPPTYDMGRSRIYPWMGRSQAPRLLNESIHASVNEAVPSPIITRVNSKKCLTFENDTMLAVFKSCKDVQGSFRQWWLEDDKKGLLKTARTGQNGETLCLSRLEKLRPEIVVQPCEQAEYPFWFFQFGYLKNFEQPFDYEECMGYNPENDGVALYPCEWVYWQEFFFDSIETNKWTMADPRTVAADRRRRYYYPGTDTPTPRI